MGLVFSIYSFASVAASPVLGRCVQLGYIRRVTLLLAGLLVVSHLFIIHGIYTFGIMSGPPGAPKLPVGA